MQCVECRETYFKKKIIIIGAGMAGISCAYRLKELGFSSVSVLEARSRIGGRIHTIDFGSYFVEEGAQWIHGQKDNIIYEFAYSNRLVDETAVNYVEAILNFKDFEREDTETIHKLIEFLEEKVNNLSSNLDSDSSVLDYLNIQFSEFKSRYSCCPPYLNGIYDWYCKLLCELNGCQNLSLLSAKLLNCYKECDGFQTVELRSGFSSILNLFLKKIPSDWIKKDTLVVRIDWTDLKISKNNDKDKDTEMKSCCCCSLGRNKYIKVFCKDGQVYLADHVIVTIPVGYLRRYESNIFNPSLSEKKRKAINCIGFDVVDKIFLEFNEPFWEKSEVFHPIWTDAFEEQFRKHHQCRSKVSSGCWLKSINRFAYTPSHPNMLCAWVVGEGAFQMESHSELEIGLDCMDILEVIFEKKLPKLQRVIRSSWLSDATTYGSYSYLSVDCAKANALPSDVAEPEYSNLSSYKHPVLLFAGEASHSSYFSTVHGACESGLREADRLHRHYRCSDVLKLTNICSSEQYKKIELLSYKKSLRDNLKVLIIGAGVAGLTCGLYLSNCNFNDVSILEAQERIGGRITSINHSGSVIELGAQWIHGIENPLSCWFNNQYIRGSYSNRTMAFYQSGATASDIQEPICATYRTKTGKEIQWPILMFAGEAVDDVSFSSAHGAFQSALKSASFLLTACSDIEMT
ncbi:spermine oxidase-like isoform X2 [Stegodyphus dumicola]|uniref:spermine oxidase-like isoform X2 n=1 Tax=Stegodyphus dumicola TaxID=202533 RepID=UPI0015A7918C|nr:spermine oxidase-like isoform X2 [Stegodyphus dumicola]